ncbi:capsid cement protein [Pseudomonas hunanensis]|uniref:capsid cement protein n=1 Tax=Pseudomonas hunanensis TaxID=1247546 RepID=UPI0030DCDF5E
MSTNYVSNGKTVTLPAPTGGSVAGIPQVIGDLAVMPLQSGSKGAAITYHTTGEWDAPAAAGMKAGSKVSVLDGQLVPPETANAKPFGKLTSDVANGAASVLIVQ